MRLIVLFVIATTSLHSARAERVLSLDQALALARAHNRDLRVARGRLAEADAAVELAWASLLPTLAVQGRYTRNYKEVDLDLGQLTGAATQLGDVIQFTTTNPAEASAIAAYEQAAARAASTQQPIVIQKLDQLDVGVTATLPLIVPSAYSNLRAAHATARAGEASYQVNLATVLLGVAQAYFAAAGSDELVSARTDAVAVARETYDNAKARVASDLANKVDVTRAEAALLRAEQAQAEAENLKATTYRALATLLGTHDSIRVVPPTVAPPTPPPVAELVAHARKARPEVAAQRETNEAATATSHANGWRWAPSLSAFGNLRAFNYAGFAGDRYAWAAGLQLDWILYDGGARDAQRHVAQAQRREGDARLELLSDTIADDVANAHDTLETKRKALATATRAAALANETLRLIRAQYQAGTTRQLDVLEAQDALVTANVELAQARFNLALADLQLRRAEGSFPGAGGAK